VGKSVDGRRGLDVGGTIDFTWGSDAYMVQAAGLEYSAHKQNGPYGPPSLVLWYGRWGTGDYYAAFAQAYAEAEYGRLNIKAGKFYTPFGSSRYKSTENFFYSWASTAMIAPHVGGGTYATYQVSDQLSVLGGWVMPEEIGETSKNNFVLGGITWNPGKRLNVVYTFAAGSNTHKNSQTMPYGADLFIHSLIATAQINKKLKYVFEWTLLNVNFFDDSPDRWLTDAGDRLYAYGINNELIYQVNKKWALGARFGVLNGNALSAVLPVSVPWHLDAIGYPPGTWGAGNTPYWYTIGLGANWTPNKWLTVKPEVRYDWLSNAEHRNVFNEGENTYQVSGGLSAVVKF
jgi:hypothetical protein